MMKKQALPDSLSDPLRQEAGRRSAPNSLVGLSIVVAISLGGLWGCATPDEAPQEERPVETSVEEAVAQPQPVVLEAGDSPFVDLTLSNLKVAGTGQDVGPGSEACSEFNLTAEQALDFLKRSVTVSEREVHDNHDVLPCYVDVVVSTNTLWDVRIRVGGTATAVEDDSPIDGVWLVCPACEQTK